MKASILQVALQSYVAQPQLAKLSQCSRSAHALIADYGWPTYARRHLYSYAITNWRRFDRLSSVGLVRECAIIDDSWENFRHISHEDVVIFPGRTMPVLKLQEDTKRLIVAGGSSLSTFTFPGHAAQPVEETYLRPSSYRDSNGRLLNDWIGRTATDDVTSIACIEGTGDFILSHVSGLLQKCRVEQPSAGGRPYVRSLCRYTHSKRTIQAIDCSKSGLLASVASHRGGIVSLYRTASPWLEATTWRVTQKPWSVLLDPSVTRPRWLAVGEAGPSPCHLYELGQDGLPVNRDDPTSLLGNSSSTAVYGFASPPQGSPLGDSGQTIISGWYDGYVRIHDLRQPSRMPTISMTDSFADSPIYSVDGGGGAGYTVVGGTARHGLIRVWDVRKASENTKTGTSIFGPGKDSSPVYGLQMEHDRLFGVTDRRAWMMKFGEPSTRKQNSDPEPGRTYTEHRSHNERHHQSLPRFSRSRIASRDSRQLSYYRHSDMSLRRIT